MNIIKEFDKDDGHFKKDAVLYARKHKEESSNELLKVITDYVDNLDKYEYQIYPISVLYGLHLLSEFRDVRLYPLLVKLLNYKLPKGMDFYDFYGDALVDRFSCYIVSTYNGDLKPLYNIVDNKNIDHYARRNTVEAIAFLCKQGKINRKEFLKYIEINLEKYKEDEDMIMAFLEAANIINAIELIRPLRKLFTDGNVDLNMYGYFDEYLNFIFNYEKKDDVFIIEDTIEMMSWWAMFDKDENNYRKELEIEKRLKEITNNNKKIGRNDPCPCGSGKKYKKCCLNKITEELPYQNYIDEDINKFPNQKDLQKLYKKEYVDMDYLIFKALATKHIPTTIKRNEEKELKIELKYLDEAFEMFKQIIENDNIKTVEEYDDIVAIHYTLYDFIYGYLDKLDEYGKYDTNVILKEDKIKNYIRENFKTEKDLEYRFTFIDCLLYIKKGKIEDGIKDFEERISKVKNKKDKIELYDDLFYLCDELKESRQAIENKIKNYIKEAPENIKKEVEEISYNYI